MACGQNHQKTVAEGRNPIAAAEPWKREKLMDDKESRKLRGYARVEFIKNIEEIKKLLADGHTMTTVHKILFEAGKITMPQRTLSGLINPDIAIRHRAKKKRERK